MRFHASNKNRRGHKRWSSFSDKKDTVISQVDFGQLLTRKFESKAIHYFVGHAKISSKLTSQCSPLFRSRRNHRYSVIVVC